LAYRATPSLGKKLGTANLTSSRIITVIAMTFLEI
jgi:hypothetical protein